MQDGVRERDMQFTLSGMDRLETLLLGINCVSLSYVVSLRCAWYSIVVTNCTSALVQGM